MSSIHVAKPDLSEGNVRLGSAAMGVQQGAGLVGIIGLVASAVIGFGGMFGTTPTFLMKSWTQNYMFVLAISLGALFFVFIQHLTRAGWSTTVRRPAELIAANLKWAWVGLIPFAALWLSGGGHVEGGDGAHSHWGPGVLFPWADLEALKAHQVAYMREVLTDSFGFAGAKITRRVVGIAHVADLIRNRLPLQGVGRDEFIQVVPLGRELVMLTLNLDFLQFVQRAWWVVTFPGLMILITVLAFNLMGDGLRDALDP